MMMGPGRLHTYRYPAILICRLDSAETEASHPKQTTHPLPEARGIKHRLRLLFLLFLYLFFSFKPTVEAVCWHEM